MIGGALARPCISYPNIFARGTIWDRYPYLLPNLFSAVAVFIGVVTGILFLEETHNLKKHRRDRGREVGDWLASKVGRLFGRKRGSDRAPEKQALLGGEHPDGDLVDVLCDIDDSLPVYRSQESSPRLQPQPDPELGEPVPVVAPAPKNGPGSPGFKTFTRPVIMNIVSYGILAL